jgi:ABC-type uncharacterized transport system permease subunit
MYRYLFYLVQPGVVSTGLLGTALQVAIAFANSFNIAGAADAISSYGLSGQLASGGLIAALTGVYYSLTRRGVSRSLAAGAGAVAGGISGTLGTALTQAFGWTEIVAGTTPLVNFTALASAIMSLVGMADASAVEPLYDPATLAQVFASTAAGGGLGALLGRFAFGGSRSRGRPSHA